MSKVLIVGGSRGIGAACVNRFADEGHEVAFIYHQNMTQADELSAKTGASAFSSDIANPLAAQKAMERAIDKLGGLDTLIICAGISQIKVLNDVSVEEWHNMIDVDLNGAFYCIKAAIPHLLKKHSGSILLVGSMWGKVGASCEVSYSTAKAGLRGMAMSLAKELGPSHITVNIVEPGVIETDMNAHLDESTLQTLKDETPLGRMGKPDEVANLLYFLASDQARFITGQAIGVDGGYAIGS